MPIVKFMQRVTEAQGSRLGDDGLRTYFSICQHINLNYPFYFFQVVANGQAGKRKWRREGQRTKTDRRAHREKRRRNSRKRLWRPRPSLHPQALPPSRSLPPLGAAGGITTYEFLPPPLPRPSASVRAPDWKVDFRGSISSPAPIKGPKPR